MKGLTATADAVLKVRLPLCYGHVNAARIAGDSISCSAMYAVLRKIVTRLADNNRYIRRKGLRMRESIAPRGRGGAQLCWCHADVG